MAGTQVAGMTGDSCTVDEPIHLVSGYLYLTRRAFGINAEHPPLAKMIEALPLLALRLYPPPNFERSENIEGKLGADFLFFNRHPPDVILNSARSVTILLTVLFGLAIALWTRRRWGPLPALIALALFCFDPNLIAHGHYVTNDLAAAFAYFLACAAWLNYLDRPGRKTLAIAAICLGMALVTKFSMLMLPLPLALMYLARRRSVRGLLRRAAVMIAGAAIVILVCYAFEVRVPITDRFVSSYLNETPQQMRADPLVPPPVAALIDPSTRAGSVVQWFCRHVPVPAYTFFKGLYRFYNHAWHGHDAYLMGSYSSTGWWYYFPVAFLVKTPLVTLAALLLACIAAALHWRHASSDVFAGLVIPAVSYFLVSLFSTIDIGIRHLLPIYAFGFIAAAVVLARLRLGRSAVLVLVPLLMVESLSSYPNYLAFFNAAAGGPRNGPRWLIDSNVDWGQDLKRFLKWADGRDLSSLCFSYFGPSAEWYYHFFSLPLSAYPTPAPCRIAAASVNEIYFKDSRIRGLRACEPQARVGGSIYVFDVKDGRCVVKTPSP